MRYINVIKKYWRIEPERKKKIGTKHGIYAK